MHEYGARDPQWIAGHYTPAQIELLAGAIERRQRRKAYAEAVMMRVAYHAKAADFKRFLGELRPDDAPDRVRNMTIDQWAALGLKVRTRPGKP